MPNYLMYVYTHALMMIPLGSKSFGVYYFKTNSSNEHIVHLVAC
jgi:hypothetical protein